MASRLFGRLLTGPLAFLLAGIADVVIYWAGSLRRALWGIPNAMREKYPPRT
jgi:hypothetical protein